jgi:uncharacterized C2H2 Zn-finger protein
MENNKTIGDPPEESGCQFCDNKEAHELTTCGRCDTVFCIYCVGSGRVGYETYDVCPGCGDIFEW